MTDPFSPTPPPTPTNTQKEIMSMNFIFIRPLLKNKVLRGFADVSFKRHKLSLLIKAKVVSKERCWQEGHNKLQIQYQIFPLPQSIHKANWKRNLAVYRHQWALVKRNQTMKDSGMENIFNFSLLKSLPSIWQSQRTLLTHSCYRDITIPEWPDLLLLLLLTSILHWMQTTKYSYKRGHHPHSPATIS